MSRVNYQLVDGLAILTFTHVGAPVIDRALMSELAAHVTTVDDRQRLLVAEEQRQEQGEHRL
ncbi:hypothetical protein, partial [Nocardia salmonicida]|uniref:hypothetical protein n=1 Tax=Nocardia salmonicida TaxID=53431 RepID=UPI0033C59FD1